MKLTREEQEMLEGKHGGAAQKAMELLVAVGECYDARHMLPVSSVHLVCANPIAAGIGGTNFIKEMAARGGKFVVPATTNPACLEPWDWREMGFDEELRQENLALSRVIAGMGGFICNTCTPYLIGHAPRMGEHVAWGESSAIIYANAVLGARTNREGGPTGLASAITGRTPACGLHLDENRCGVLKFTVNTELKGATDYATLGCFAGRIAQDRVPIFTGIPAAVSRDELKCLGTALANAGSVAHYHVVGVTREAPTEEAASGSKKISASDTFEFGSRELRKTEESLCSAGPEEADLVVLGCPHASIEQVRSYARTLSGRRVKKDVDIWILISHAIKQYAEDIGYAAIIESAGARLVSNTCPGTMPEDYFEKRGYRAVATDATKQAYNFSTTRDVRCYYGNLDRFIDAITDRR